MRKYLVFLIMVVAVLTCVNITKATLLVANFDSYSEGDYFFDSFTDGGITFYDMDRYSDERGSFMIESTVETKMGPFFSPPNYLKFGTSHVPGPGVSFGRFGSVKIGFDMLAIFASIEIFHFRRTTSQNTLRLDALSGETVVASELMRLDIPSPTVIAHQNLSISGVVFDSLQLVSSGPDHDGAIAIGVDNVTIIPEPATMLLLGLGGLLLRRRR